MPQKIVADDEIRTFKSVELIDLIQNIVDRFCWFKKTK